MRALALLLIVGCSRADPPKALPDPAPPVATAPAPQPAAPKPAPSSAAPDKYACKTDADCTVSCSQGAVSVAWWEAWPKIGECKDGCAEIDTAACRNGRCVAINNSGTIDPTCTNRDAGP